MAFLMEGIFTGARFEKPKLLRSATRCGLTIVLTISFLVTACSKHHSSAVQTTAAPDTSPALTDHAPVYQKSSAAPAMQTAQAPAEPDLKELNRSLLRWILSNRRRPQNFEDFAATANVTIPPPPAGKKYVLGKDMHVLLVDR